MLWKSGQTVKSKSAERRDAGQGKAQQNNPKSVGREVKKRTRLPDRKKTPGSTRRDTSGGGKEQGGATPAGKAAAVKSAA